MELIKSRGKAIGSGVHTRKWCLSLRFSGSCIYDPRHLPEATETLLFPYCMLNNLDHTKTDFNFNIPNSSVANGVGEMSGVGQFASYSKAYEFRCQFTASKHVFVTSQTTDSLHTVDSF